MKNWISLAVVGGLITGCGALKHEKSSNAQGVSLAENNIAAPIASTPSSTPFPSVTLNNLNSSLSTWVSPDAKSFEVVGAISKQDSIALTGDSEESVRLLGTLSLTRETKDYSAHYDGTEFFPTDHKSDEDHPEINVYLGQNGDPNTSMILIASADYQNLGLGKTAINVQYDVKLVCTQWRVPAANDPLHIFQNTCMDQDSVVNCQSFGSCFSSCDTINALGATNPPNYGQEMLNVGSSNCLTQAQLPTQSVSLLNTSVANEYRILPLLGGEVQASEVILPGQQI